MSVIHKKTAPQEEAAQPSTEETAITALQKQNAELAEQITSLQLALSELYEKEGVKNG